MEWYWIVLITVVVVHIINVIIYQVAGEDGVAFMCATVWFPIFVLFYPYRAHKTYKRSCKFYENKGVSYWQYMLGKRVR